MSEYPSFDTLHWLLLCQSILIWMVNDFFLSIFKCFSDVEFGSKLSPLCLLTIFVTARKWYGFLFILLFPYLVEVPCHIGYCCIIVILLIIVLEKS